MTFKKTDDVGRNTKISKEELEQEKILIEVKHNDDELHNTNEVEEQAQVADEVEETGNVIHFSNISVFYSFTDMSVIFPKGKVRKEVSGMQNGIPSGTQSK